MKKKETIIITEKRDASAHYKLEIKRKKNKTVYKLFGYTNYHHHLLTVVDNGNNLRISHATDPMGEYCMSMYYISV